MAPRPAGSRRRQMRCPNPRVPLCAADHLQSDRSLRAELQVGDQSTPRAQRPETIGATAGPGGCRRYASIVGFLPPPVDTGHAYRRTCTRCHGALRGGPRQPQAKVAGPCADPAERWSSLREPPRGVEPRTYALPGCRAHSRGALPALTAHLSALTTPSDQRQHNPCPTPCPTIESGAVPPSVRTASLEAPVMADERQAAASTSREQGLDCRGLGGTD
jgi:hypothetical protein